MISARYATNFERGFIMVNIKEISASTAKDLAFSKEELEELEKAKKMPITFDKDCPETTPERALKFRRVNPSRSTLRA
ncbi:hypothetical protein [Butyribacter intestini]|uniref:hypothetical protein n=2 Tax=Butyribacter intestini TaxID=1703332 RepID=UPI003848E3D2|nr:hypothetical protein [Roseburia hominis]